MMPVNSVIGGIRLIVETLIFQNLIIHRQPLFHDLQII